MNEDDRDSSPLKRKAFNSVGRTKKPNSQPLPGSNGRKRNAANGHAPSEDFVIDKLIDVGDDDANDEANDEEEVLYKRQGDDEDDDLVLSTNNNVSMEKWDVTRPATCLQSFKYVTKLHQFLDEFSHFFKRVCPSVDPSVTH